MKYPRRAAGAVLAGLLLGLLAVLLAPASPAAAHAALLRTSPVAGTVVNRLPAEFVMVFSEPVRLVPGKVHALAPGGKVADTGVTVRGDEVHVALRPGSPNGTYLINYRVISADSHPVDGGIIMYVGQSSGPPPAAGAGQRTDPVVATALASARYVGYVGLILLVGPAFVLAMLWPRRLPRRVPYRLLAIGIGAIAVSALAELYIQAPYAAGNGLFSVSGADLREVLGSRYGAVHIIRLAVVAAVAVLLRPFVAAPAAAPAGAVPEKAFAGARVAAANVGDGDGAGTGDDGAAGTGGDRASADGGTAKSAAAGDGGGAQPRGTATDRTLLAILAVVGLATWPLSGHPGASALPEVTTVADVAHLGAMSLWLGGLVVLVGYLLRKANGRELAALLPVWSRWAFRAVGVLVVAGIVQALVEIGSIDALFHTTYGRVVLLKVALLELIVLAAAYSRHLAGATSAKAAKANRPRLRWSVTVELMIAVLVIGAAAALVQTTPAVTATSAPPASELFSTRLTSPLYTVQVDIDPARTGQNSVHLVANAPDGGPITVVEWTVTAALPAKGIEPITVPTTKITDDHAVGQADLPTAGAWQFKLTLRTSDVDQATVTTTVQVN